MPVVTSQHGPESITAPPAVRLVELMAELERTAGDIASTVRGPETLQHLRTAIRHLEATCDHLANASRAMAFAATDAPGRGQLARRHPAAKRAAWRLHHLSNAFAASRDASAVVGGAAEALERSLAESR